MVCCFACASPNPLVFCIRITPFSSISSCCQNLSAPSTPVIVTSSTVNVLVSHLAVTCKLYRLILVLIHPYVCIATTVSYSYLRKLFCAQTYRGFSALLAHDPQLVSEPFLEYHPLERLLGILGIYFLRIGVSLKTKCKTLSKNQ